MNNTFQQNVRQLPSRCKLTHGERRRQKSSELFQSSSAEEKAAFRQRLLLLALGEKKFWWSLMTVWSLMTSSTYLIKNVVKDQGVAYLVVEQLGEAWSLYEYPFQGRCCKASCARALQGELREGATATRAARGRYCKASCARALLQGELL